MSRGLNAGNRNQGSNWASNAKRTKIHNRDGWRCAWCRCVVARYGDPDRIRLHRAIATVDHVIPRCKGGSNDIRNLVTSCMACNRQRGGMSFVAMALQVAARNGESKADVLYRVVSIPRGVAA